MSEFNSDDLKKLYVPPTTSHKGQNGKLLIIGGSTLFHAASLWALEIASKIVDMVYYSSVAENNQLVYEAKKQFRNGIIVRREDLESYVDEADCILMGPGMVRQAFRIKNLELRIKDIKEINAITDEGVQTRMLTEYLLKKYPQKKWVLDAGSLQEMESEWIPNNAILTPHTGEFERLFHSQMTNDKLQMTNKIQNPNVTLVSEMAKKYSCVILLKGVEDVICSPDACKIVKGGNSGMTKGGTGDVLAGLAASFYCKNEPLLSACAASYFNKKAADALFERQGYYFNASDLVNMLPLVMKDILV